MERKYKSKRNNWSRRLNLLFVEAMFIDIELYFEHDITYWRYKCAWRV